MAYAVPTFSHTTRRLDVILTTHTVSIGLTGVWMDIETVEGGVGVGRTHRGTLDA